LPSQILRGQDQQKLYPRYHVYPVTHQVAELRGANPTTTKAIGMHLLKFLDLHYKIQRTINHSAKFRLDQLIELKDTLQKIF